MTGKMQSLAVIFISIAICFAAYHTFKAPAMKYMTEVEKKISREHLKSAFRDKNGYRTALDYDSVVKEIDYYFDNFNPFGYGYRDLTFIAEELIEHNRSRIGMPDRMNNMADFDRAFIAAMHLLRHYKHYDNILDAIFVCSDASQAFFDKKPDYADHDRIFDERAYNYNLPTDEAVSEMYERTKDFNTAMHADAMLDFVNSHIIPDPMKTNAK